MMQRYNNYETTGQKGSIQQCLRIDVSVFLQEIFRLNTHHEKGHLHRRRSMTLQKAIDYVNIILIKHKLAGEFYSQQAELTVKDLIERQP
jgi:hypothetical protein